MLAWGSQTVSPSFGFWSSSLYFSSSCFMIYPYQSDLYFLNSEHGISEKKQKAKILEHWNEVLIFNNFGYIYICEWAMWIFLLIVLVDLVHPSLIKEESTKDQILRCPSDYREGPQSQLFIISFWVFFSIFAVCFIYFCVDWNLNNS